MIDGHDHTQCDYTCRAERRLLAAVIKRAWWDVCRGTPGRMRDALDYFEGPNLDADCDWLGLDPAAVRERVKVKERMRMSKIKIFTEEQVLALHGRYAAEGLSIEALAREAGMSSSTLARAFGQAGLPIRKPGEHGRRRRQPRRAPRSVRELNRLISDIAAVPGVTGIRVTFEMAIEQAELPAENRP